MSGRVLVVHDDEELRAIVMDALEALLEAEVQESGSLAAGAAVAEAWPPHVVVTAGGWEGPDATAGLALAADLARQWGTHPILLVTVAQMVAMARDPRAAVVHQFVPLPPVAEALRDAVRSCMRRVAASVPDGAAPGHAGGAGSAAASADSADLAISPRSAENA